MKKHVRSKAEALKKTRPIESHETASWANIFKTRPDSNVSIPSEMEVINAKEYVDKNQK